MSTEEASTRKAKKAQRDAERKKAGKKRKREEAAEQEAAGEDELKHDFVSLAGGDESKVAKDSTPASKKRKVGGEAIDRDHAAKDEASSGKAKKRRKTSKPTGSAQDEDTRHGDATEINATTDELPASSKSSKSRFILFIGNLPYIATDESITAHFKSIQPFVLRHRVDPKTKKSKGFAFLEFENYDRMKTCLKLYHHSTFDPAAAEGKKKDGAEDAVEKKGKKSKDRSRRINVELTAGGGGKGDERKEKIKLKNAKLEEERKRRREVEEKEAARREKKGKGKKATRGNAVMAEERAGGRDAEAGGDEGGMQGVHPARLARMKA